MSLKLMLQPWMTVIRTMEARRIPEFGRRQKVRPTPIRGGPHSRFAST